MKKVFSVVTLLLSFVTIILAQDLEDEPGVPDNRDETYTNPVIYADYSDPDVIKVDDNFYMVSSSFSHFPGLPILHSKDLVNWEIIGHAAENYPFAEFNKPQHGKGIWAPSLRYHDNKYWIYFGDPDHGIVMTKSKNPEGPWEPLKIVLKGKGLIDPCPLWNEDGKAYLVHAWAKSRAGFNGILTVREMSTDGEKVFGERIDVYNGGTENYTIEGPKFYKRNGYYYIFAPAGGVRNGWQTVLRSKNVYGPYEIRTVLEQGNTDINGPHQGGWIELNSGESWFVHFQDKDAYGRVVHLNPVTWKNGWPIIGIDPDGNEIGEPVKTYKKPDVGKTYSVRVPQTNDEFDSTKLGLQWQWEALPDSNWYSLTENPGNLRLYSQLKNDTLNLYQIPFVLGQKLPAESFEATVKLSLHPQTNSHKAGIAILGKSYAALSLCRKDSKYILKYVKDVDAYTGNKEAALDSVILDSSLVYFKIRVLPNAECYFYYSSDDRNYEEIGGKFTAVEGRWVGAKIGLFSITKEKTSNGYSDFDYIKFSPIERRSFLQN